MKKIIAMLFFTILCACGESETDIGAGYKYIQLDGSNYTIVDKNSHIVVDPNVARYKVLGCYVVGERNDANIDDRLSKKFGYFILDMHSGVLVEGLDKTRFENALRARRLPVGEF